MGTPAGQPTQVDTNTFIEVPGDDPSSVGAAPGDPQSLLRLYASTVREINQHGQSILTIVVGFATIAAAVLAVTPTSWLLKDFDDMCCTKVDVSGRCCFGVNESIRAPCCNTTANRGLYLVPWPAGDQNVTRCRVSQSAVLFRRSGKAIFMCLAIATAAVACFVTMKIPPAVIASERRRLIELLVFEHKKRDFHFLWHRKVYRLANVHYRFFLDSIGVMTLLLVVCFSMALCISLEDYFHDDNFCNMLQSSLTWSDIFRYLWVAIVTFIFCIVWNAFSLHKSWHIENKRYPFLINHVCLRDDSPDCGNRDAQSKPGLSRLWQYFKVYWHGCTHFGVS